VSAFVSWARRRRALAALLGGWLGGAVRWRRSLAALLVCVRGSAWGRGASCIAQPVRRGHPRRGERALPPWLAPSVCGGEDAPSPGGTPRRRERSAWGWGASCIAQRVRCAPGSPGERALPPWVRLPLRDRGVGRFVYRTACAMRPPCGAGERVRPPWLRLSPTAAGLGALCIAQRARCAPPCCVAWCPAPCPAPFARSEEWAGVERCGCRRACVMRPLCGVGCGARHSVDRCPSYAERHGVDRCVTAQPVGWAPAVPALLLPPFVCSGGAWGALRVPLGVRDAPALGRGPPVPHPHASR
jgi:hypothetical protein